MESVPNLAALDLWVIGIYLAGLFLLGSILERFVKDSGDMFAAGGKSPWWLSGVSAYMTMFSSGTFVVWGGIAFLGGMVAVSICMTLGISALLVGFLLAGKWKDAGVLSASEFIRERYGSGAVQLYTWLGMLVRVLGSAVALYSIAVLACALIHLPDPETLNGISATLVRFVRDSASGTFSVPLAIVLIGLIILVISGNLWAVLVTDGLQFIVLAVSVTVVVPLLLNQDAVGGLSGFLEAARHTPALFKHGGELMTASGKTMLSPASGPFTWLFLGGWIVIHCFKIGGEWSFVQRFTCVPTRRDATKVGLIFGALYLLSPMVWMLPPMIYRVMHPVTDMAAGDVTRLAEQAYILACASVLPTGLVGLLVAAMLSATVSMVDSEVNVYAGAVTRDIYARLVHREKDDRHLVRAGRFFTVLISLLVIAVAIAIPHMGGAQNVILTITGLFVGPMVLPTIWGLFSKRIGRSAVYITVLTGALCSAILKFGVNGLTFVQEHSRSLEVLVGIVPPILTLVVLEWIGREKQER